MYENHIIQEWTEQDLQRLLEINTAIANGADILVFAEEIAELYAKKPNKTLSSEEIAERNRIIMDLLNKQTIVKEDPEIN